MSWLDKLSHVALGFISGLVWWIDCKASLTLTGLFLLYEYVEETKVEDEMYHEVKEYTIGYTIGLLLSIIRFLLPV